MSQYAEGTIGAYFEAAATLFGSTSRPCQWLKRKADESVNGMYERIAADEIEAVRNLIHAFKEGQANE